MEESEEKPPPVARAQSAVSLGDRSVPSWPWPFQWSSLRALAYVLPRAGAAQWSRMAESGEDVGRCRRGHKGFSRELGLLRSRRKTAQRAGREETEEEEEEGEIPTPPRSCPCRQLDPDWGCAEARRYKGPQSPQVRAWEQIPLSTARAPGAVLGCMLAARTASSKDQRPVQ